MKYKKPPLIALGIAGIILISLLLTLMSGNQSNLPQYEGKDPLQSSCESGSSQIDGDFTDFRKGNYSLLVPTDWERMEVEGCDTFIHAASQSTIQIRTYDYDYHVNITTADAMQQYITSIQGIFYGFQMNSTSDFTTVFDKDDYIYMVEVQWDRNSIIAIVGSVPTEYYDRQRQREIIEKSVTSLKVQWEDPIAEDVLLIYSDTAQMEFALPTAYTTQAIDSGINAVREDTGAELTIMLTPTTSDLLNMTEVEYVSFSSQNCSDFMLRSFSNNGGRIDGSATYTLDGDQYILLQSIVPWYDNECIMTLTVPAALSEEDVTLFQKCVGYVRFFSDLPEEQQPQSQISNQTEVSSQPSPSESSAVESVPKFEYDDDGNLYYTE